MFAHLKQKYFIFILNNLSKFFNKLYMMST